MSSLVPTGYDAARSRIEEDDLDRWRSEEAMPLTDELKLRMKEAEGKKD